MRYLRVFFIDIRYTTSVNEYQLSLRKIQSATVILKVVQAGIVNITLLCNLLITFRSLSRGEATVGGMVKVVMTDPVQILLRLALTH